MDMLSDFLRKNKNLLVLSGEQVLTSIVNVKKIKRSEYRQAVMYKLEGYLCQNIDEFYFFIGEKHGYDLSVSVVLKKYFDKAVNEHGYSFDKITVDYLLLPKIPGAMVAAQIGGRLLVRFCKNMGFSVPVEMAHDILLDYIKKYKINCIYIYSESPVDFNVPVDVKHFSLLELELSEKNSTTNFSERNIFNDVNFKATFAMCLLVLFVFFGSMCIKTVFYKHESKYLSNRINHIRSANHNLAVEKIEQRAVRYRYLERPDEFYDQFRKISKVLSFFQSVKILSLNYHNLRFTLKLSSRSMKSYYHLAKAFRDAGFSVVQKNLLLGGSAIIDFELEAKQ